MARTNSLTNFLTDVASAIRQQTKDTPVQAIPASEFDTKILSIKTTGNYQQKSITITENGTQTVLPDVTYDAIEQINITVNVPITPLQLKSYTFTSNQTLTLRPDTGFDGFSAVEITVDVDNQLTVNVSNGVIENDTLILNADTETIEV